MSSNKTTISTDYILMLKTDSPKLEWGGEWQAGHIFSKNYVYMVVRDGKLLFKVSPGVYINYLTGVIIENPELWKEPLKCGIDFVYIPAEALPFLKNQPGRRARSFKIICTGYEDCMDCDNEDCKYRE